MPALVSTSSRSIFLFNDAHDDKGRFAPSAGGGASGLKAKAGRIARRVGKAAVWLPYHAEHAAKAGIAALATHAKEIATGRMESLTAPGTQGAADNAARADAWAKSMGGKTIKGLKMAGVGVLKLAYAPWISGAKAVEAVARAKGLSPEDAAKLRTLTTAYDCVNCKAVVYGLHAVGMPGLAAVSTLIPTASVAYLAGSLAKNPRIVGGLAKAAVMKVAGAVGSAHAHTTAAGYFSRGGTGDVNIRARAAVGTLADAIKAHSGDDWYWAVLTAAMDHSSNPAQAVAIADKASKDIG